MNIHDKLRDALEHMSPEQVLGEAYRDKLTGAWNRNAWELVKHTGPVALCDLDNLKMVNDIDGYREGDKLLCQLAAELERVFPGRVFRIGGDEFVVTGVSSSELLVKMMRVKLSQHRYFSFGSGHNLREADMLMKSHKQARKRARAGAGESSIHIV